MFNPPTIPTDYELTSIEFSLLQLSARVEPPTSSSRHTSQTTNKNTSTKSSSMPLTSIAQLSAGQVAWLTSDRSRKYPDVYGIISHPGLILKRLSSKYVAIVPLFDNPRYSSLYPPVTVDGHAYYVAIPNIRIVVSDHISSVRLIGELSTYTFDTLVKQITTFLTP